MSNNRQKMRIPTPLVVILAGLIFGLWILGLVLIICLCWGATGWKATALTLMLIDMFMIPAWIDWKAGHRNE